MAQPETTTAPSIPRSILKALFIAFPMLALCVLGIVTAGASPLYANADGSQPQGGATATPTPAVCVNNNYVIATATATVVAGTFDIGNHTDEGTSFVSLPFSFRLYDQYFNGVTVSPNGTAEFNTAIGDYENSCLPAVSMPTYTIFLLWDDQRTDLAGKGIYTSVTGVAPSRIFNIEWRTAYFDGGEANYELRLYENSPNNRFDILYIFVGNGNGNATSGVQKNNVLYTQWFCNGTGGVPSVNRLLTFTQPPPPCGTATPTATSTRTSTATATATASNTAVGPSNTPTRTSTSTSTSTRTSTSTNTPIIPTNTSTSTSTNTSTPTRTNTPTNTNTPLPTQTPGGPTATPIPTNTNTATATNTVPPTSTSVPPTSTRTNTTGPTSTAAPTNTTGPTSTPGAATNTSVAGTPTSTACPLVFTDVPSDHTFYASIRCLACRGIINGYNTGCETGNPCFKPGNNVTRGQLSKIVANAAGFNEPAGGQQFEDVPVGSTFFDVVWRLANRGYVNGYACGGAGEPCGGGNLPYFRPNANITRGQISKIVANAAGFTEPAGAQQFEDVAVGSTFFEFVWRLASRNIMSGYVCGGAGEPCGGGNLPYFRPANNATRGQASKIVANTFYPDCVTP